MSQKGKGIKSNLGLERPKGLRDDQRLFIVQYDSSTKNPFFQAILGEILAENYNATDYILAWGDEAFPLHYNQLTSIITYSKPRSNGIANIVDIAKAVDLFGLSRLFIISSGECGLAIDLISADQYLISKNIVIKECNAFIVTQGSFNAHVAAPFCRHCPSKITYIHGTLRNIQRINIRTVSENDMKLLQTLSQIQTIDDWNKYYVSIKNALEARLMCSERDLVMRDTIIKMRNRVVNSLTISAVSPVDSFVQALESNDIDTALNLGSEIVQTAVTPEDIERQTSLLLKLTDGDINYQPSFENDSIRSNRVSRSKEVVEFNHINAIELQSSAGVFECPVSYEEETDPCIMVVLPERPLLARIENDVVEKLLDCPLSSMILSKLLVKIADHLDHPISLKTLREAHAINKPINKSPITRKQLLGAICLGAHPTHVAATNYILSHLFSGGKKLGNMDLWFAVIWLMIEQGKVPYLNEILPFVREQMVFRLRKSISTASLVGIPGYILTKMPLGAACWFSLVSPSFSTPPPVSYDTVRCHMMHTVPLRKLCELIGYTVPDTTVPYINRLRVLFSLRLMSKKNIYPMKALLRGLYQKVVFIDVKNVSKEVLEGERKASVPCIPVDGPADKEQIEKILEMLPKYCKDVPIEEVYWIGSMLTQACQLTDIKIDINWAAPPLPEPVIQWPHYVGVLDKLKRRNIKISINTMRPFYDILIDSGGIPEYTTWEQQFKRIVALDKPRFNNSKLYGYFVRRYKKYPTLEEFCVFVLSRLTVTGTYQVLVPDILEFAEYTLSQFEIFEKVDPVEASKRFLRSTCINARRKMEKKL